MTCHPLHVIKQCPQKHAYLVGRESTIIRLGFTEQARTVPFPIGREHKSQARHVRAFVIKAGGVGVGKRLGDAQADVSSAPGVGKTDVKQVCREAKLHADAYGVEEIRPASRSNWPLTWKEFFGTPIPLPAEAASCFGAHQFDRIIAIVVTQGGQHPLRW
ncbi:hypothetical protein AQZ50_15785 [Novosphingobium sp. Fuku2-ISO-50]|nr:hypothetical protein AQZ50_15785 [Novosphingobium sp. Fuku2-ISO-50]